MTPLGEARPPSSAALQEAFERVVDGRAPVPAVPAAAPRPVPSGPGAPLRIEALMGLDDAAFIQAAYSALLGRQPDEAGVRHYGDELAAGRSRVMVLGGLRYSDEGRRVGTPVPGLRGRFLLHRLYRTRGIGRVARTLTGIAALPGLLRDVSRLSVEMDALRSAPAPTMQLLPALVEQAEVTERGLARMQAALRAMDLQIDELSRRLRRDPWAAPVLALAERADTQAERIARLEGLATLDPAFTQSVNEVGEALAALRGRFGWPLEGAGLAASVEATLREPRNLAVRAIGAAEDGQARLRDQERRLSLILHDVRRLAPGTRMAEAAGEQQDRLLDPLYIAFEDRFRGSRADIKERQRVYLDLLREAGAGTPDRPIVDVGSGRGELLELLGEEGLQARGVDLNEGMVALCAQAGLDCLHGDAVSYLAGLEPGSLGAVTGFHIIEHLPFPAMVALLDASLRALAPGGVVVFETPNPANLLVASRWFYLDPTHRNPLPGEMVAMIAEARGFVEVGIRALHPMQTRFEAQDALLAGQLDAIFHGPQDYALIARKP